jgi:putative solute:sodium symporter small subunit
VSAIDERTYWRGVLRRTILLLAIWIVAGPIAGILIVDRLNAFSLAGLPLGFWISQQGSILVFVCLIFVYAWLADRADAARGPGDDTTPASGRGG